MKTITLEDVVAFHGHSCPGLAMGFKVAEVAMKKLGVDRSTDEDVVAVVENNSCAIDAIQVITGCTSGKGNLIFHDYGKQVYTFYNRSRDQSIRIAIRWPGIKESDEERAYWQKYLAGDRSKEIVAAVTGLKGRKVKAILDADDQELFTFSQASMPPPQKAQIFQTLTCQSCGEKMMEPKAVKRGESYVCVPCSQKKD